MPCYNCKWYIPATDTDTWWCGYNGEPPYPCDEEDREPEEDDGLEPGKEPLNG